MELLGNPGKRPITLSPTYRYKKDENVPRAEAQHAAVSGEGQPAGAASQLDPASANDSLMLPGPGGKTPTSLIGQQYCPETVQKAQLAPAEGGPSKSAPSNNQY